MMSPHSTTDHAFSELVQLLVAGFRTDLRTSHLDSTFLPSRARTIELIELVRKLMFPGFFDERKLTSAAIVQHTTHLLEQVRELAFEQVRESINYDINRVRGQRQADHSEHCDHEAHRVVDAFMMRLPEVRRMLSLDVQAAFDGDPAAQSTDEIIFCYPGLDAIFIHRLAHELWNLKVPLLPRIMSEYAHNETGIDLHPGATIGESFFIDHGTGVVIGETTIIGKRVKVYQGVTLGALSTKGGQAWRGRKRHPTIEDDVTIYGGAIILGGETVIGQGSTIGGSVFLTQSVPPQSSVSMKPPELKVRSRTAKGKLRTTTVEVHMPPLDFQI